MPKFKSAHETGVTIYPPGKPAIRLSPSDAYETDDKDEVKTLRASDDVTEVKGTK